MFFSLKRNTRIFGIRAIDDARQVAENDAGMMKARVGIAALDLRASLVRAHEVPAQLVVLLELSLK